jgi:hypothetical protein
MRCVFEKAKNTGMRQHRGRREKKAGNWSWPPGRKNRKKEGRSGAAPLQEKRKRLFEFFDHHGKLQLGLRE